MLNLFSTSLLTDGIKFEAKRLFKKTRITTVSFEVTLSCNCNCHHCDLGGILKNEIQIKPKDYARIVHDLMPLVVQISGGEPLLRKDIVDIIKAIKQFGNLPYLIFVTNGALLNEKKYLELRNAGINQFSISLDFPDERHDQFRRHPGLFKHLKETIPKLAKYGFNNIILNSAITKANFKELVRLTQKAMEWGVLISYSAYTPLRTGNREYTFEDKEDLKTLRKATLQLIEFKKRTTCIINSKRILLGILKFFEKGQVPHCQAGNKFVVVMPDGSLVPCSMKRYKFTDLNELRKKFSHHNFCNGCYVSIRCYSELPIFERLKEISNILR